MSLLEGIIAHGNRGEARGLNVIRCVDGFTVSVIAGDGTYCAPCPGWGVSRDYPGPYTSVEVGYPSARPEPWDTWRPRCENEEDPTSTVYAGVPVDVVRALIAAHGGEVPK